MPAALLKLYFTIFLLQGYRCSYSNENHYSEIKVSGGKTEVNVGEPNFATNTWRTKLKSFQGRWEMCKNTVIQEVVRKRPGVLFFSVRMNETEQVNPVLWVWFVFDQAGCVLFLIVRQVCLFRVCFFGFEDKDRFSYERSTRVQGKRNWIMIEMLFYFFCLQSCGANIYISTNYDGFIEMIHP